MRVVKAAREADQPIYLRGAGSTYAGGAKPTRGGVVIDVSPMNRIVEIDRGRGLVVVEPGVTYGELLAVLGRSVGDYRWCHRLAWTWNRVAEISEHG